MNSLDGDRVFFRSLATRGAHELPEHLADVIDVVKAAGFDLVVVETPGIGQGDAAIVPFVDTSMYVMTPEFGAASQLEKIDMLDFADVVAINKFERRGAKDALRDVGRQLVRNREAFGQQPEDMPVFGTSAATFNDDGVTALYQHLRGLLGRAGAAASTRARCRRSTSGTPPASARSCPTDRVRYLAEITETVRGYHAAHRGAGRGRPPGAAPRGGQRRARRGRSTHGDVPAAAREGPQARCPARSPSSSRPGPRSSSPTPATSRSSKVRDKEIHTKLTRESLSRQQDPARRAAPFADHGELVRFWRRENLPGLLPLHRRRLPVQARRRGPGPDVRRRGRPVPHQPPLQAALRRRRRPPGSRRPSTRSPSTAATPTSAPTSTARSAPPASRSPRWTT